MRTLRNRPRKDEDQRDDSRECDNKCDTADQGRWSFVKAMGRRRRLRNRLGPGRKIGRRASLRTGCPGRRHRGRRRNVGSLFACGRGLLAKSLGSKPTIVGRLVVTGWATHVRLLRATWAGFFYCRYGQRCFGTAWDAETFQKHYHISSISPGSNVPWRLQCQIETRQKAR